ncbi:MAG: PAS domain-containing protein [Lentimicrobium sp.]|nr:PAS domain-containing protein [Lentimicrobium sp.]
MKDPKETESKTPDYKDIPVEIKDKLELLELMVKESSDVIWIMDSNLKTTYMSPSVERQLGYKVDEYSRLTLSERLPAESFELSQHIFQYEILPVMKGERLYDGKPIIYEMLHRHKNGQMVWGEISFSFLRDKNEKITSILGITRNIDARKLAQDELARSKEEFRMLVENTNDWVWKIDSDNKFIYSNPLAEKILGYPLSQIIGSTPFDFSDPETKETFKTNFEQLIKSALPIEGYRITLLDKNKRLVYLDVNGSPVFDSKGELEGYQGIARDMSGYQLLINKLKRLEILQSTLLSLPDIGVIELDNNFEVLQWSAGATHIFGYSRGEAVVGKIFSSLWESAVWISFCNALEKNSHPVPTPFIIREGRNKRQDSKTIQCIWYVNPLIEDEKLKGVWIYVKDISEIFEIQDSLANYKLFFESFCGAAVFTDTRLRINGFSTTTLNYFSPQTSSVKKGTHIRKLFKKESVRSLLEQGAIYAARKGNWRGDVDLGNNSEGKITTLHIVGLHDSKSKFKGFAFLFDPQETLPDIE